MEGDPFDPGRWSAPGGFAPPAPPKRPPRPRRGGRFLRGPIPWDWIEAARALPGQALSVGLVMWFEAGCRDARTVPVTLARLAGAGMTTKTARRACRALERAELISVAHSPGRALVVTLNDPPRKS